MYFLFFFSVNFLSFLLSSRLASYKAESGSIEYVLLTDVGSTCAYGVCWSGRAGLAKEMIMVDGIRLQSRF